LLDRIEDGAARRQEDDTVADFHRLPSAGVPAHPDHAINEPSTENDLHVTRMIRTARAEITVRAEITMGEGVADSATGHRCTPYQLVQMQGCVSECE